MQIHSQIKLFVTIDSPLYREAILYRLLLQPDIDLVGESSTGVETLSKLGRNNTDVLIIEENLRDNDGLSISEIALRENPSLSILLLVDTQISQSRLSIYLAAGIKTVVSKTQTNQELIKALFYIRTGQVYIDGEQFRTRNRESNATQNKFYELSEREKEVAQLIAKRVTIKEIASQLGVSNKTVHTYKERILIKMGFERQPELMLFMHRYFHQSLP